ncbi:MAG: acyl carrier protein [Turicibacter sp.]|nr:acyl carrier protein [Turicibacter sp.]
MLDQIKSVMAEALNVNEEEINLESNLKEDLGIDSLDAVELIMELEDTFDLKIEESEANGFVTVKNIVDFIESKSA